MKFRVSELAVAVAVAGVASAARGQAQPRAFPPPLPEIATLVLPDGPMAPVAANPQAATFLETASVVKTGDVVELRTLEVYEPGAVTVWGPAVQMVVRRSVDCAQRTMTEHGAVAYDRRGVAVVWLAPDAARPIVPNRLADFLARMVCDGSPSPRPVVQGHAAALAATREDIAAYRRARGLPEG